MSTIASDGARLSTREALLRQVARTSIQPALADRFPVPMSRLMVELATRTVPVHRHTQVRRGHLAGIPVEVVRPARGGTDDSLLLYAHGGGFALGSPRTHRPLTAALAHGMGATVVVPDYRLAPEDPFPAAVDDVAAVYRTLVERRPQRLTVAGDSAGGNLALGVAVGAAEAGLRTPDAVGAISPFVDPTLAGASWDTAGCAMLTRPGGEAFSRHYTPRGEHDDPRVAIHLADLSQLPPTLVQVGGAEALRDDAVLFAAAAARVDAPVHVQEWPGMWHVHQAMPGLLPAADRAIADLAAFLAEATLPAAVRPAATFR